VRAVTSPTPRLLGPRLLGLEHLHELPPPRHERAERVDRRGRQRPHGRPHRFGKLRQQPGVDPIRLRQLPRAAGKVPRLARVDHDHREPARREGRGHRGFVPPGRLQDHQRRAHGGQPLDELGRPRLVPGHRKRFPARPHVHLHGRLRDIDANKDLFHVPSL
jgi:hypothetical protein